MKKRKQNSRVIVTLRRSLLLSQFPPGILEAKFLGKKSELDEIFFPPPLNLNIGEFDVLLTKQLSA